MFLLFNLFNVNSDLDQEDLYQNLEKETNMLKDKLENSLDNLSDAMNQVKKYQKEIEESRDFWKMTFDSVESPIAILDNESNIIKANKAFIDITGNLSEIKGKLICNIFCKNERENISPCKTRCTNEYIFKSNKLYKIKFNRIFDENQNLRGCVFVAHDITEEHQIQEYLSEITAKYMGIFNAAYDAIILLDVNSKKILEANEAATRIYGYKSNEFRCLSALDLSAEIEETRDAIDTHEKRIPLRFHKRKDGTIIPVEISASYYDHEGTIYSVNVIRDLSDKISSEAFDLCLQKLFLK